MRLLLIHFVCIVSYAAAQRSFPGDFSFGVSSAAYQVEGGWNADDKGESVWDKWIHEGWFVAGDYSNGDVAADTYHHGPDDVQYLQAMGVQHYRFSISWPRVLPNGHRSYISESGIAYYNRLIDALVAAGIKPMVTLHHWDTPNALQDVGGWLNDEISDWFEDYARLCFERFGDRVKLWLTFNEPVAVCRGGYEDGSNPPTIKDEGTGAYHCAHNVLLSHGKAYRVYDREFRANQNGRVSATIDTSWYDANLDVDSDREAARRNLVFNYEWWVNPIIEGDYPELIKQVVQENSRQEGLDRSRLPEFSEDEKNMMRGSWDYIGLNTYTSYLCWAAQPWGDAIPSWYRDVAVDCRQPDDWKPGSGWLRSTPWGTRRLLNYIKDRYNNPEVIITENGWSDGGELEDYDRIEFHRLYLEEILNAILDDGCNVSGYTGWSFLDDFEWGGGYMAKFGFIHVDFNDPDRARTRKMSSYVYENIIKTRQIDWDYYPPWPPATWKVNTTRTG